MQEIKIEGLRALVQSGAVNTLKIVGSADIGVALEVNGMTLVSTGKKQARLFAKLDTLFAFLRSEGIAVGVIQFDLTHWDPKQLSLWKRPDRQKDASEE